MEIIPDKRKLVILVEQANDGRLCLPDFQRDFVWTREQVADLLRSVLRGYFIGTLLLLRCNPQKPPFAPVFVRGANPLPRNPHPELLALDGQQRLSSLLYALTAPKLALKDTSHRRWFFIDLAKMTEDPDDDSLVFDRAPRELDGLDKPEQQYMKRVLPLTCLLRPGDFLKWRDGLEDWLRANDPPGLAEFRNTWRESLSELASGFQTFEIPLVELPAVDEKDPESIGRVCAIFEKLNSTGTDLSVYDLMTARLYRSGVRLHDLWDRAVTENPRLAKWSKGKADTNKFGVLLLRILALRRDLDVKPSVLIDLDATKFEEDFNRAAAAMERALEMVELVNPDGFGVFDAKWLPGFGVLSVLAALRAELEDRKLGDVQRSELRRWYWMNVFLERYSSAVESKSRKDYAEMKRHWIEGGPLPEVFQDAQARIGSPGFSIRGSATGASSVYRGVFCLLALNGARDWRRGETIQLQQLQDHHIFPQAYLSDTASRNEGGSTPFSIGR